MGLAINTNIASLTALRTLGLNERKQLRTLERLSTGLRINRSGDDPSGSVISNLLANQVKGLEQAAENSQNAINMINTADEALNQIQGLLLEIKSAVVFTLNDGTTSLEQRLAEQDTVDQVIRAIDRIAETTNYGGKDLLSGAVGYQTSNSIADQIDNLHIRSISYPVGVTSRSFTIAVETNPTKGTVTLADVSADAGATIRITGPRGTAQISVASGATASGFAGAINTVADLTGVYASGVYSATPYGAAGAADVSLLTENYGSEQRIRVEVLTGTVSGTAIIDGTSTAGPRTQGAVLFDTGSDGVVTVQGKAFSGVGNHFNIVNDVADFSFDLDPDRLPFSSSVTITVRDTGMRFQLTDKTRMSDTLRLGIDSMNAASLGMDAFNDRLEEAILGGTGPSGSVLRGGFLSSLITGGDNSVIENPRNANVIVEAAIKKVAKMRSFLGSIIGGTLEPNLDFINVHKQELGESLSTIRDLNFAEEASNFVKSQVIFQANIAVLAASNSISQGVLSLLGI